MKNYRGEQSGSLRQAAAYHSLMSARRILATKQPQYLYQKLSGALQFENNRCHNYGTRHGTTTAAPRLALISASWLYRVVEHYRSLPRDLVELWVGLNGDQVYKNLMRKWVIFNC